jgi:hypothetical protein
MPAAGAWTVVCIFIASRVRSLMSFANLVPALTAKLETRPGIGAPTWSGSAGSAFWRGAWF